MAPLRSCLLLVALLASLAWPTLADDALVPSAGGHVTLSADHTTAYITDGSFSLVSVPGAAGTKNSNCKKQFVDAAHQVVSCTGSCVDIDCVQCTFDSIATLNCLCFGGVCGDPHFLGGQGVSFDFHGWPDHDYAIISDQDFQLSAHMIGQEVTETGVTGTWMSRLGFMYNFEGKTNRVELALKEVDNVVTATPVLLINGEVVDFPTSELIRSDIALTLSVQNATQKKMIIKIAEYVTAELSVASHEFPDGFHFDFSLFHLKTTNTVHGVLGQTFSLDRVYYLASLLADVKFGSKESYTEADVIEGVEGDYELSDLFATDFAFSRFSSAASGLTLRKLLGSPAVADVPYVIRSDGGAMKISLA